MTSPRQNLRWILEQLQVPEDVISMSLELTNDWDARGLSSEERVEEIKRTLFSE